MPNLSYKLTLLTEGANSGPYYNVTYTTASVFYPVLAGTPAYLPNVGDSVVVSIPSGSFSYLAFNLNNGIGGGCELCDNNVIFVITGSAPTSSCCTPTLNSVTTSGSFITIAYTRLTGSLCLDCSSVTLQTSSNGINFSSTTTASCTASQFVINAPTASCDGYTTYYRVFQTCTGSVTSSFSNTGSFFTSGSGATCCTPSITSVALSGSTTSSLLVNYSAGASGCCLTCSFVTLTTSSNGVDFGGAVTASCTGSQFIVAAPACFTTGSYRIQQTCSGSVTSSFSATSSFINTCPSTGSVEYIIDNAASGGSATACSGSTTTSPVWAAPGNTTPIVSMFLYNESTLTTTFVGSFGWRKLVGPLGTYAIEIDTTGEITNKVDC
jgi:hypothetical protein